MYSAFIKIDDAAQDLKADPDALVGNIIWRCAGRCRMRRQNRTCTIFEGTVLKVVQYAKGRKKALDLDFGARPPIALVRWDQEFNWRGCYVPLDIKMYCEGGHTFRLKRDDGRVRLRIRRHRHRKRRQRQQQWQ
jgi:hypothetical protein